MTDALSWLESWKGKSDGCQTHQFQLGDTFRTNTSAVSNFIQRTTHSIPLSTVHSQLMVLLNIFLQFTYKITNIVTQNKDVQGSFVYANNTLEDCDVTEVQTSVSLGDRQVEVVVSHLFCDTMNMGADGIYVRYRPR